MNEQVVNNPFVVGKYLSDKYFCDRSEETEFLRKQILNGRDVALISPRRIGKSGLIQHFFNQPDIQEKYYVFFVDIYATTSLAEFVFIWERDIRTVKTSSCSVERTVLPNGLITQNGFQVGSNNRKSVF